MMRSLLSSRVARLAAAPAGAATAITTTSFFLGEKSVSTASNRLVQKSLHNGLQLQQRRAFSDPVKIAGDSTTARFKSTSTVANLQKGVERQSFVDWYEMHLHASPIKTKMVTGGILWGVGDAVAQGVPVMMQKNASTVPFEYDWVRTGRAAFYGFAIHAPLSHLHYNFLEYLTIKAGVKGLGITIFKTFMEQFVYWSWISNSLYHGAMGAMQGLSPKDIVDRINDVLWDTQKAQWIFWIPVQLINFRFVPVRHNLNVTLVVSIVWTALLSAWYPPEEPGKVKEEMEKKKEGSESRSVT